MTKLWQFYTLELLLSFFSTATSFFFTFMIATEFEYGELEVSIVAFLSYFPFLLVGLKSGVWADRIQPKRIVKFGLLIYSASILISSSTLYHNNYYLHVIGIGVSNLMLGCVSLVFSNTISAAVPRLFSKSDWKNANAKLLFYRNIGLMGGPALAGVILDTSLPIYFIYFVLIICVISGFLSKNISVNDDLLESEHLDTSVILGLKETLNNKVLRKMIVHGAFSNFMTAMIEVSIYLLFTRIYGLDPSTVGFLFLAKKLGGVAGTKSLSFIPKSIEPKNLLIILSFFSGLLWIIIGTLQINQITATIIGISLFLLGAISSVFNIFMATFRQNVVDIKEQGRTLSGIRFLLFCSFPPGVVSGYVVMEHLEIRYIYILAGVCIALSSFILLGIKNLEVEI